LQADSQGIVTGGGEGGCGSAGGGGTDGTVGTDGSGGTGGTAAVVAATTVETACSTGSVTWSTAVFAAVTVFATGVGLPAGRALRTRGRDGTETGVETEVEVEVDAGEACSACGAVALSGACGSGVSPEVSNRGRRPLAVAR
jgi:hypothetical protein